jgi:VanZ family protein
MRADSAAELAASHAALQETGLDSGRVHRSPAFPLFLAYALFVVYATLLPFQFLTEAASLHAKLAWINWNPFVLVTGEPTPITDVVMNIGFFLPLGFIAFHAQRQRSARSAILRATCAGLLLSATVEAMQFFTPTRNPATSDVLTNGTGAALGAIMAALFRSQLERRLRLRAQAWMSREPLLPVLVGCAVLVVVASLVPFDVAGSVNWIKRGIRLARLDPRSGPLEWADLVQAIVEYATLAGLATHVAARLTRWSAPRRFALCWLGAAGLAMALEVGQIFVRSRVSSTRDVLAAMGGALCGCILALALGNGPRARIGWALVAVGSLLSLTVQALTPFRFQLDMHEMMGRLRFTALVPYSSYYYKATVAAVGDFLEGLLSYVPLAFILARQRKLDTSSRLRDAVPVILWCALFALALEVMQLGLPRRYPEVSDVLTAGLGAALGAAAWRWIAHLGTPAGTGAPNTNGPAPSQGRSQSSSTARPAADGEPVDQSIAPASS